MGRGVELTGADLAFAVETHRCRYSAAPPGGNGHDNGNLFLEDGVTLQDNGVYVITLDLTQGIHDAIMTVDYNGEQQFEEKPVS